MTANLRSSSSGFMERGVYIAPYSVKGSRVLVAIDSKGEARKHQPIVDDMSEIMMTAWLRNLLDRIDPIPVLTLVVDREHAFRRADPLPRPLMAAPHDDPYGLNDAPALRIV